MNHRFLVNSDFHREEHLDPQYSAMLCLVAQLCPTLCPPGSSVHWDSPGKHWSGLPCPPPGDLPNPGLLHCRWILYCLSHQESPTHSIKKKKEEKNDTSTTKPKGSISLPQNSLKSRIVISQVHSQIRSQYLDAHY